MEYTEFIEKVKLGLEEKGGDTLQVTMTNLIKTNRNKEPSLALSKAGETVVPVFYLRPHYEEYKKGKTLEHIVDEIYYIYCTQNRKKQIDMSFFKDYEKVKDHIAFKLVNREKNSEMLQKVPHRQYLDLEIVYYYRMEHESIGKGSILVQNTHLSYWNVGEEELFRNSMKNTAKLFPYEFLSLQEIIGESFCSASEIEEHRIPMYVLTDSERYFGASVIVYNKVLEEVAERIGSDFYILPSSIHECMIVPALLYVDCRELHEMVHEINGACVAEEEILGESVYLYRRELKTIEIAWESHA